MATRRTARPRPASRPTPASCPASATRARPAPRAKPPATKLAPATQAACERIWAAVAAIPRGCVRTYGTIAAAAGMPKRARFVAYALKHAPARLELPWHRVVAAGGRIALPSGSRAHAEQCRRLAAEGVRVARGRAELPDETGAGALDALLWGAPR